MSKAKNIKNPKYSFTAEVCVKMNLARKDSPVSIESLLIDQVSLKTIITLSWGLEPIMSK